MATYVDNMRMYAEVKNGGSVVKGYWSHLTSDTDEELHAFAAKLGLRREWHQPSPPSSRSHYDLVESKRKLAIKLGAIAVRFGCEPWRTGKRRGDIYADDARERLPEPSLFDGLEPELTPDVPGRKGPSPRAKKAIENLDVVRRSMSVEDFDDIVDMFIYRAKLEREAKAREQPGADDDPI